MPRPRPRSGHSVTRRDVARAAGVSDAVVSYTLSGSAPVAPSTAARVLAAVEELGYRPNQAARALRSGSTQTLALIVPEGTNPYFAELAHEIEVAARRRGFALYTTSTSEDADSTRQRMRDFASRLVDGVLIVPGDRDIDQSQLNSVGIPWVLVDASIHRSGVSSYGIDLERGARDAVGHLLADGCRRIAFCGDARPTDKRFLGWQRELADAAVEPGPVVSAAFERSSGYRAMGELLELDRRPDAVFFASDTLAVGALRRLHESGVAIPEDISLVGFDGSWESEYTWPTLTTVRQPTVDIAEQAVSHLIDAHRASTTAARSSETDDGSLLLLPGELVVRGSCGPHPVVDQA